MYPEKKKSSAALAITAATLFSIAPLNTTASQSSTGKTHKCMGGNSCKGQSFCHTATHACAGQNSCKGQGWIKATKSECDQRGGVIKVSQMEQKGTDCQHQGKGMQGQKHAGKHHGKMHGKKHGKNNHQHRQRMEERLDRIEAMLQQLLEQNQASSANN